MPIQKSKCCAVTFPEKTQSGCLLTPDKEPTTGQILDTTKIQLGEPMSVIRVTIGNMDNGLLIIAEMPQRQLHHKVPPQSE